MQKVHFIAIGGATMHHLAIAISKRSSFLVSGSDIQIEEPALSRLKTNKLLPEKLGWFPEKIQKGLSAVIVGTQVSEDNPELIKAKQLGVKIYSFAEYLFFSTRSKTRIVVSGSYGKTTIAAMIIFVLKQLRMEVDYMVESPVTGLENQIRISYEARIAVIEGDEQLTLPLDKRPKFLLYKPHIAVLTGISEESTKIYPDFETYIQQFKTFVEQMEFQGRLIFYKNDKHLKEINENLRRDIVAFPYNTPIHEFHNGVTYLKTKRSEVPVNTSDEYHLQNIEAARLACKQVGVSDDQFYSVIGEFNGFTKS